MAFTISLLYSLSFPRTGMYNVVDLLSLEVFTIMYQGLILSRIEID
jgi:hypothetical protein